MTRVYCGTFLKRAFENHSVSAIADVSPKLQLDLKCHQSLNFDSVETKNVFTFHSRPTQCLYTNVSTMY